MLHIFCCGRLQGRVPCLDFALNGAVVLFMGRVQFAFVHVFVFYPFLRGLADRISGLAVRNRESQSLWQGEMPVSQSQQRLFPKDI